MPDFWLDEYGLAFGGLPAKLTKLHACCWLISSSFQQRPHKFKLCLASQLIRSCLQAAFPTLIEKRAERVTMSRWELPFLPREAGAYILYPELGGWSDEPSLVREVDFHLLLEQRPEPQFLFSFLENVLLLPA